MRPQSSTDQQGSGEQKKSVFDRLGRQLDTNRPNNRRSPAQYGELPTHSMMHEADFSGRYGRADPNMLDMNAWRYQNERRHMHTGRDRQPQAIGPPLQPHFEMDIQPGRQAPPYYPHSHPSQYLGNPAMLPGPQTPQLIGPDTMSMGMQQRRPSPKYDRHGNLIRGPMRMEPGMSPPGPYMGPPGPMMHPTSYDMPTMRPGMYPQNRWDENFEMGPPMMGRLLPEERFMEQQRFQQQQQQLAQQKNQMMNTDMSGGQQPNFEAPRYSKWRERRDVITNLDRQTAQSSSKTDSLKSSLQQPDNRGTKKANLTRETKQIAREQCANKQAGGKKGATTSSDKQDETVKADNKKKAQVDPSEISDGEIVDDDSSDEEDLSKSSSTKVSIDHIDESHVMSRVRGPYSRMAPEDMHYFDSKKRRRLHDREDYNMDYETISDEELDNFMSDKKLVHSGKIDSQGSDDGKSSSELELLNALGLDWAHLIELSKQSRKEAPTSGSALRRFSMPNYIPTLGITRELAGPGIYDLILKVCH